MMKVTVRREACCSQDDQSGPLEAVYDIDGDATFSSLVLDIVASGFLQFSSTHDRLSGEVDGTRLVEVFASDAFGAGPPAFGASANLRACEVLDGRTLSFRFRHVLRES